MFKLTCACGANYKVPDALAGKRVKCKHCGRPIAVPEAVAVGSVDGGLDLGDWASTENAQTAVRPANPVAAVPAARSAGSERSEYHGPALGQQLAKFAKDCAWSFAFIAESGNIGSFIAVAIVASLLPFLSFGLCFGRIGQIIIYGWILAFLFNVIQEAASGERTLPKLTLTNGVVEDILLPLWKAIVVTALVMMPAIAWLIVNWNALMAASVNPVGFWVCVAVGGFFWPITMLVVAIGGLGSLSRLDLIFVTIARTLVPYLVTCIFLGITITLFGVANSMLA